MGTQASLATREGWAGMEPEVASPHFPALVLQKDRGESEGRGNLQPSFVIWLCSVFFPVLCVCVDSHEGVVR